jgi:hypothetical protein
MLPLSVLQCLLTICVVSTLADDPFTQERNGVVATTTTTATASSTASSSGSTTTTSASATPTTSAVDNAFHWNGGEIAAVVILVGFIVFGIVFIATWQARRMLAQRKDNAGIGAYIKHERNPSMDMDVTDTDALIVMNQREQSPHNPQFYSNRNSNNDLEGQLTGVSADQSRYSTAGAPAPSMVVSPANSIRHSRSPSPYSQPVLRPSSENTLRRLYSFEEIPRSTTPDLLSEGVDRRNALSSNPPSALPASPPTRT